jgi:macrolide-specific efflux system membrane fusion protein
MKTAPAKRGRRWGVAPALVLLSVLAVAGVIWGWTPGAVSDTVAVTRADLETRVTALGMLQPRRYVDVGAQVSGQVQHLHVKPGDRVVKGQLLVEIDPSVQRATVVAGRAALAGLRAQRADQEAQHHLAELQQRRQRAMAEHGATRLEDVDTAEATLASSVARLAHLDARIAQTQATLSADEARLGYTRIYAPMGGTVVSMESREGQTLNATYQTPHVLRIADLSSMTVWAEVSEADVQRIHPGMPVYFTTLGSDRRRWTGKVRQLLPAPPAAAGRAGAQDAATPSTASASKVVVYTALFDVDNADGALMPQMTAQVSFVEQSAPDAVLVPLAALSPVAGREGDFTVNVLGADGRVAPRAVRVGLRDRFAAQVLHGLEPGERLVPAGADGRAAAP